MHLLLHHPQVLPAVPPREFKGAVSRDYLFPQTAIQPKDAEITHASPPSRYVQPKNADKIL
jgi:hypothetical protein